MTSQSTFSRKIIDLCQQENAPLGGQTIPDAFNSIRLKRNGENVDALAARLLTVPHSDSVPLYGVFVWADAMHPTSWQKLEEDVADFIASGCLTPGLQQRNALMCWVISHLADFKAIFEACS